MGKKDIVAKKYIDDPDIFADPFNCLLYGGKQVIDPKHLRPLDTTLVATPPYGTNGAILPVKRVRDSLKCLTAMEDENSTYLLLGIENQSEVHYSMPVRDMLYDALQYVMQVEEAIRTRKKYKGKNKITDGKVTSGEYLIGFHREDKLTPVITLVLYFGSKKWDAPKSLHEMLVVQDEKILSFVPDYKINLIAPAEMSDKKIRRLSTDLREVLLFIKYEKDEKKLDEIVNGSARFRHLRRQAVQTINVMTGARIPIKKGEERIDVCKGIQDMKKRARREGRKEGTEIGRKEGIEIGIDRGERRKSKAVAVYLLQQGMLSHQHIAEATGLSLEEIKKIDEERSA